MFDYLIVLVTGNPPIGTHIDVWNDELYALLFDINQWVDTLVTNVLSLFL